MKIDNLNSVYIKVHGDAGVEKELFDRFRFRVPGYVHMPTYKAGFWDGYINLYDRKKKTIYAGLYNKVIEHLKNKEIEYEDNVDRAAFDFSGIEADEFIKLLKLPFEVRDYQKKAFIKSVREPRRVNVMPTGSGKSLVIYMLARYFNQKTLIVVPTINLVHQLANDFVSYGLKKEVHKIYQGQETESDALLTITTWQSAHDLPDKFFAQYRAVIVDECHLAKAKSITKIMEKLQKCPVRFGFTGSLDGSLTNEMVLEGLFGPVDTIATSSELIEQKHLASFEIRSIVLKYPDEERKYVYDKEFNYAQEVEWIVTHQRRNNFIKKLALSLNGSTLILFQYVEKHGVVLHQMIAEATDRPVHIIHGKVEGDEREEIRQLIHEQPNSILIGSNQTVSTGINIPSLKNVIFTSPTKSRIRTLQSIGRVLRTDENKDKAILFDIADDLQYKRYKNFTLKHFLERIEIYRSEQFPFKTYNVKI